VVKLEKPSEEYEGIYARFAELLKKKKSDADGTPLRLVADSFLLAPGRTSRTFSGNSRRAALSCGPSNEDRSAVGPGGRPEAGT